MQKEVIVVAIPQVYQQDDPKVVRGTSACIVLYNVTLPVAIRGRERFYLLRSLSLFAIESSSVIL